MKSNKLLSKYAVTKELFHGTSKVTCEMVYKSGFDRSFAGSRGKVTENGINNNNNSKL